MKMHLEDIDKIRLAVSKQIPQARKSKLGQFMTPAPIARFMASLFDQQGGDICKLIDAGAGIGSLSAAFLDRVSSGKLPFNRIQMTAFEIDEHMRQHLGAVMTRYMPALDLGTTIVEGDFIENAVNNIQFQTGGRFTHAILNPPYKKISTSSRHRLLLREIGVETVNLYTAFLALVIALMEDGGEIVAITPRSFCNGPYYRPFREFMLARCAVQQIHVFMSRNKAFKDDEVLQETVIIKLKKGAAQGDVVISVSEDDSFADMASTTYDFNEIVFPNDEESFIHVPTAETDQHTVSSVIAGTLEDIAVEVSTGPVVDFRLKEHLRAMPETDGVPLLYANHLTTGAVTWPNPACRKPNCIIVNSETRKWLLPNGVYTAVKRFSSKEERRRIVATVVEPSNFPPGQLLGFENHLNVLHRKKAGLPKSLAHGLAAYLNSTAADQHLRRFSGHTQVNATDLRKLPYPSEKALLALGEWSIRSGRLSQNDIDQKIAELNETI
jgi:tRNA1(Val) A37 N6-methylase TrmN6